MSFRVSPSGVSQVDGAAAATVLVESMVLGVPRASRGEFAPPPRAYKGWLQEFST